MRQILRLRAVEVTLTYARNAVVIVGIIVIIGGLQMLQAATEKRTRGP